MFKIQINNTFLDTRLEIDFLMFESFWGTDLCIYSTYQCTLRYKLTGTSKKTVINHHHIPQAYILLHSNHLHATVCVYYNREK